MGDPWLFVSLILSLICFFACTLGISVGTALVSSSSLLIFGVLSGVSASGFGAAVLEPTFVESSPRLWS
jgi:hypothetical protein